MLERFVPVFLLSALLYVAPPAARAAEPAMSAMSAMAASSPTAMKGATKDAMKGDKPGEWMDYHPKKDSQAKPKGEQIPSGTLVVVAYIIIWLVVLLYALLLGLRQKRLVSELEQLRRRLDELEPPPDELESPPDGGEAP